MKKTFVLTYAATLLLGFAWHGLYAALPCPLTALLAPVRGSVWEQLKLLFFPPMAVAFVLCFFRRGTQRRYWSSVLAAVLGMPALLCGIYYPLTAGLGVPELPGDGAVLYALVLLAGQGAAARLVRSGRAEPILGPLTIAAGVFWAALTVFTAAAPPLPIFKVK